MAAVRKKDIWICSAWQDRKKVTVHTCVSSNEKGAVALANIFAGRQPYFLPKMASKSVMVPMPFYKRSSFIDIPFGMPYFKLFYF